MASKKVKASKKASTEVLTERAKREIFDVCGWAEALPGVLEDAMQDYVDRISELENALDIYAAFDAKVMDKDRGACARNALRYRIHPHSVEAIPGWWGHLKPGEAPGTLRKLLTKPTHRQKAE